MSSATAPPPAPEDRTRDDLPARDVALRLHAAAIHLLRLVRQVDVAAGLGPAQLSALSVLVFGGPRSPGALAAAEQVRPPSMTRVVQELETAGYVRRRPDASDKRAIRLEATAKGRRLMLDGRDRRAALLASWLESIDERRAPGDLPRPAGDRNSDPRGLATACHSARKVRAGSTCMARDAG